MSLTLSPKEIVKELDEYIIGQAEAKRAVAVALRNRYRRSKVTDEVKEEITPKNIIMKGPTGVGKTEIARRLARLMKAPFLKVEATKYTEVGYVGRDVESMIRDLVEVAIRLVKEEKRIETYEKARPAVERRLFDVVYAAKKAALKTPEPEKFKEEIKADLERGLLDDFQIEVDIAEQPKPLQLMPGMDADLNIGELFGGMFPRRHKRRKLSVALAREIFYTEESEKLIDSDTVNAEAIRRAEQDGIIFIDEFDKIATKSSKSSGPEVSREGVQRDILPIVEGSTISTKYGLIKTDYILFIAAGAFHISRVEDLIPELQGRFPVRVELQTLTEQDFSRILTDTKHSMISQYQALLKVDNINLIFTPDAIEEIAHVSAEENLASENIGARRLHAVLEHLTEDVSFNADGRHPMLDVKIDKAYVKKSFASLQKAYDLKKYIL